MEKQTQRTTAGGVMASEEDRISHLPDEILHEILRRIRSTKLAAKATVLSKRWVDIWSSYPILEFDERDFSSSTPQSLQQFSSAAAEKFSRTPVEAVRINVTNRQPWRMKDGTLVGNLLKLAVNVKTSPKQIEICGESCGNDTQRRRCQCLDSILELLRSSTGSVDVTTNSGFGSSLITKLHLFGVSFTDEQLLNDVIAGSPVLETLTMIRVSWTDSGRCSQVPMVVVGDHPNLRTLWIDNAHTKIYIEITGAHSLETLILLPRKSGDDELEISSTQNLQVINIQGDLTWRGDTIHELVSKSPSLRSLTLIDLNQQIRELKFTNNHKLREVKLMNCRRLPKVIEMDASALPSFHYRGGRDSSFPVMILRNAEKESDCKVLASSSSSFYFELVDNFVDFRDLVAILASLSRFRITLDFSGLHFHSLKLSADEKIRFTPPTIEHVKFQTTMYLSSYGGEDFLDSLFWSCRPKFLTVTVARYGPYPKVVSPLEFVCKRFMEQCRPHYCEGLCKCWRHNLKEMKILKRAANTSCVNLEKDEAKDISTYELSSLAQAEQIPFILTWL